MVSRRNFFMITAMLLVVFFMLQMIAVVRETWNNYDTNEYSDHAASRLKQSDTWKERNADKKATARSENDIMYIGDVESDGLGIAVLQWAEYTKRTITVKPSIDSVAIMRKQPYLIIIDSKAIDFSRDVPTLDYLVREGTHLIFCNLPDVSVVKNDETLQRLLGIYWIFRDEIHLSGVHLFDGFLLGGETIYEPQNEEEEQNQDLPLDIPWYYISSGTKTYAMGIVENQRDYIDENLKVEDQNERLPAVIWRNSIGDARIFAVNGDYMNDVTAIGFLEAMWYEMEPYALYPVVNAQNLSVANAPNLAAENEVELQKLYSRPAQALFRDIVWPGIETIREKLDMSANCFLAPQMVYDDDCYPSPDDWKECMKMYKESRAEVGWSGVQNGAVSLQEKCKLDQQFLADLKSQYIYQTYFLTQETLEELMESDEEEVWQQLDYSGKQTLRTIVTEYEENEPLFSFVAPDLTVQCATNDGFKHTYSDNFRLRSLETALGYSHILLELDRVFWPESEEDRWEKLSKDFSSYTYTYWKPFLAFDGTTASESDRRIRRFLALEYTKERKGQKISLNIEHFEEEAWFLLRTHGETLMEMTGGTFEKIEEDAWLLHITQPHATITVKEKEKLTFD